MSEVLQDLDILVVVELIETLLVGLDSLYMMPRLEIAVPRVDEGVGGVCCALAHQVKHLFGLLEAAFLGDAARDALGCEDVVRVLA